MRTIVVAMVRSCEVLRFQARGWTLTRDNGTSTTTERSFGTDHEALTTARRLPTSSTWALEHRT